MPRGRPKGSRNQKGYLGGITRLPEESDGEWKGRYQREVNRRYDERHREARAEKARQRRSIKRKLEGPPKARGKNKKPLIGDLKQEPGESDADWRLRYIREKQRRWRANNPERAAEQRRKLQRSDKHRAKRREWLSENPEMVIRWQRRYFEKNKLKRLAALKAWRIENPDRFKDAVRKWFAAHPGVARAANALHRARAVQATPPWMWSMFGKEIEKIYAKCVRVGLQTGIPHHVDHIYPLAGKTSCGLHVPWNLQILPAIENIKKRNKSPEEHNGAPK